MKISTSFWLTWSVLPQSSNVSNVFQVSKPAPAWSCLNTSVIFFLLSTSSSSSSPFSFCFSSSLLPLFLFLLDACAWGPLKTDLLFLAKWQECCNNECCFCNSTADSCDEVDVGLSSHSGRNCCYWVFGTHSCGKMRAGVPWCIVQIQLCARTFRFIGLSTTTACCFIEYGLGFG